MAEVSELIGMALDSEVARVQDLFKIIWREGEPYLAPDGFYRFHPSTDWSQGGPIIERERIELIPQWVVVEGYEDRRWEAAISAMWGGYGQTALIAAMRAFVASKK